MRHLRLFSYQMLLSHIGVAVLTVLTIGTLFILILDQGVSLSEYQVRSMIDFNSWQFDDQGLVNTFGFNPEGFGMVVGEGNNVLYIAGDAPCSAGDKLDVCDDHLTPLNLSISSPNIFKSCAISDRQEKCPRLESSIDFTGSYILLNFNNNINKPLILTGESRLICRHQAAA